MVSEAPRGTTLVAIVETMVFIVETTVFLVETMVCIVETMVFIVKTMVFTFSHVFAPGTHGRGLVLYSFRLRLIKRRIY